MDRRNRNRLGRNQRGLTIVEYAIAGAVIVAVTTAAFIALGGAANGQIERLTSAVESR